MKPKSISALRYKVADLAATVAFYEGLGFSVAENDGQRAKVYVNWFSVEFQLDPDIDTSPKTGPLVLVSVAVEAFYEAAIAAGYTPEEKLHQTPSGRTEFSLRDPSGYLMVFFEKK